MLENKSAKLDQEFAHYYSASCHQRDSREAFQWIRDAWNLFVVNISLWLMNILCIGFSCILLMQLVGVFPQLGALISIVIFVVIKLLMVGVYYCAHKSQLSHDVDFEDLFIAFNYQRVPLVLLSLILAVGSQLIPSVLLNIVFLEPVNQQQFFELLKSPTWYQQLSSSGLLIGGLLYSVYLMVVFFATQLVFFNKAGVLEALLLSFSACLKNILPLSLYALLLFAMAVIGIVSSGLGLIIALPIVLLSNYTIYASLFGSAKLESLDSSDYQFSNEHGQQQKQTAADSTFDA